MRTGVVFNDVNNNQRYDLNEGLSGITIAAGGLTTTTNAAGGWSLALANGQYLVQASGGLFSTPSVVPVVVSGNNVEADFAVGLSTGYVNFTRWLNTAPILASGTPVMDSVLQNDPNPPGEAISRLVGSSITDPDPAAQKGIAVFGLTGTSNGTWQYSLDSGATWTSVGTVSASAALLLRDTDLVRFVPNVGFTGTAAVSYRAWDQTSGTVGGKFAVTANGGSTAFSTASVSRRASMLRSRSGGQLAADLQTATTDYLTSGGAWHGGYHVIIVSNGVPPTRPGASVSKRLTARRVVRRELS